MRKFCIAAQLLLPVLACTSLSHGVALHPLEDEGELYLQLRPLPPDIRDLRLEVASASVIGVGGAQIPLELRHPSISPDERSERLLAWGRLPTGTYAGLILQLRKGKELEPVRVDAPFTLGRKQAKVLAVQPPAFAVSVPAKTLAGLGVWCSNLAQHNVTVFDKRSLEVSDVIPTGNSPWGIALDALQNRAYVALGGDDQVEVFDILSSARIAGIRLSTGDAPRDLALTPDRRLLLTANSGSNTVSFIDPASMIEVGRARAGEEPTWILMDRKGARAYVTNARGNSITVIDVAGRSVVGTLAVEDSPLRPQLDRAGGRLYVAQPRIAYLTVFSLPDLSVQKRVFVGLGTSAIKVDPATDLIYLAKRDENRLAVYDPFAFIPVGFVEVPDAASHLFIDDAENVLFLLLPESRSVAALHLNSRRSLGADDVGEEPRSCALMGERN